MIDNTPIKTPWHLWLVGGGSLLINAAGAFDFTLIQLRVPAYMDQLAPMQQDFFAAFPQWVQASWAIAVWFAVLGSIYMLLRKAAAISLFTVSLIAMAATAVHNFLLSKVSMIDIMGAAGLVFTAFIFVIAVFLVFYSRHMRDQRVLE